MTQGATLTLTLKLNPNSIQDVKTEGGPAKRDMPPAPKLRWVRGWDLAGSIYLVKRTPEHLMDVNFCCGNMLKWKKKFPDLHLEVNPKGLGLGKTIIDREFSLVIRVAVWYTSFV